MYSEKVILENLELFHKVEGWMPTYHTNEQVEEFKDYIDRITATTTNSRNSNIQLGRSISEQRAKQIRRFVQNEQALCQLDAHYFLTRYAYFCDNQGEIFKFSARASQEVFLKILEQFDLDQTAIEILLLKARQLGMSTLVALLFLHRILFVPNTKAIMASVKADKSELLAHVIEVALDKLPWWLFPRKTTDRIKLAKFTNGSVLSIQSGSQATGIGQGWTPTCTHISEIGDLPNPKKVIEEGLLRATHATRRLFQVFEGTGNGNTGWQADKWRDAKDKWPQGKSRLFPMFLSWPLAPDQYPEKDWLRAHPVPEGWSPMEVTRKHVRRCESYIRNTPYLARICGASWKMPRHQQWYWEFEYLQALAIHNEKNFLSQMPADDVEALQGKFDAIFHPDVIELVTAESEQDDYEDYGVVGHSIEEEFEPHEEEIDYEKERIHVTWLSHRGQFYEWDLIPLKKIEDGSETDDKKSLGRIRIWEHPRANCNYSFGVDTSNGLGTDECDRSSLSGARNGRDGQCDSQVVEFCHNRVNAPQMVGFVACLAAYYGERTIDPRGVKLAVEQRERPGDDCVLQLKFMGFTWHHTRIRYDDKKVNENAGTKDGWFTDMVTRPLMMNRFINAIKGGWYRPRSKWLIAEMAGLELKVTLTGKTKIDHQQNKHDDRWIAACISYFTVHHLDNLADRNTKRYTPPNSHLPDIDVGYSNYNELSFGE